MTQKLPRWHDEHDLQLTELWERIDSNRIVVKARQTVQIGGGGGRVGRAGSRRRARDGNR